MNKMHTTLFHFNRIQATMCHDMHFRLQTQLFSQQSNIFGCTATRAIDTGYIMNGFHPLERHFFKFKISLHSLHAYHRPLNINTLSCNEVCFFMSLITLLVTSGDIYDKGFRATLHGDNLKINQLQHPCNECNVILHLIFPILPTFLPSTR